MDNKIKVMVVDDSALVRKVMTHILNSDPQIEVVAQAADPVFAERKLEKVQPDVITLDVEMPRMDGVTFLKKLMREKPIPTVICSSLVGNDSDTTLLAMQYGAVDIISKPQLGVQEFLEESAILITDAVKGAARAKLKKIKKYTESKRKVLSVARDIESAEAMAETTHKVIAIGASTGGTNAIRTVLEAMPKNSPGIVIVQHMPEKFTSNFAKSLNETCALEVREAKDGDKVIPGVALIAPGNKHMLLKRSGAQYFVEIADGPLVSRHRPSVDVLFRSVSRSAGRNAVGCILTGMGSDGAAGMKEMKNAGATNFGQDEESCVVFGMPKQAWQNDALQRLLPLEEISATLLNTCYERIVASC